MERSDTPFDTCAWGLADSLYGALIHEAGHALGITGGVALSGWDDSLGGHPSISGSTMNYDDYDLKIPSLFRPATMELPAEPDCSPHPFDVMAINALYQSAPRAVIEGPVTGNEMTRVEFRVGQVSNLTLPYTYEWSMVGQWNLDFSPDNMSNPVSIELPDVAPNDSVEERTVIIEVSVTNANGTMTRDRHRIEVKP